jgi:hypothetical protein
MGRSGFALTAVVLLASVALRADEPPKTDSTPREATKFYTYRGYAVTYPESWKLRDAGAGPTASQQIYKPAGADSLTAWWFFDRKPNPRNHTAEKVRDGMAATMAQRMKGFKLKDKGTLTIDGKRAAYVTYEHSVVDPPCVARDIFIPTPDGSVTIIAETAVATEWKAASPDLDRITRSMKFPK